MSSGSLVTRGPRAGRAVRLSSNAHRASVQVLALIGVMGVVAAEGTCRVMRSVVAAEPRDEVEVTPQRPSGSGSSLDGDPEQLNADEHITRAMRLLNLGRMKIAEKELRAAAELDPASGRPEFILGLVYVLVYDDSRSAAAHFREASRRTPDDALAHNNYAVCSYWCARSAGMVDAFRSALKHCDEREPVLANVRRIIVRGDINQRHMLTLIALYDDASANEPDGAQDDGAEGGLKERRPRMFSVDVVEEDRGESPRLLFRARDRLPSRVVRFAERAVEVD